MTLGQYSIGQLTLFYNIMTPADENDQNPSQKPVEYWPPSNQYQTAYLILEAADVVANSVIINDKRVWYYILIWNTCFRSSFKIPFYLVPPLFSRLGHTHFFTSGSYAAFRGMTLLCHIEGSMITAVWTHLRMFLNSKFHHLCV
jgi:hypothetical protein